MRKRSASSISMKQKIAALSENQRATTTVHIHLCIQAIVYENMIIPMSEESVDAFSDMEETLKRVYIDNIKEVIALVPTPPIVMINRDESSGDDSEPVPEVPTDVPSDLEEDAYRYLLDQGFGIPELASLDLDEDALYCWLQEAQQEAKLHRRVRGYLSDDLTWMTLMPPMVLPTEEGAGRGPRYAPELPPPQRERNRKLIADGCIVAAREERLQDIWCRRLQEELLAIDAPVLAALKGSLDPDRAAQLLVGKTRATTLKRYLGYYRQWRLWLAEAKLRYPPGRPADLVDYLLARRDEPCGHSIPEAILKVISWVEKVAEFPEEQRATHGRLAWAAKDKITEVLSEGARLIKRAPRYPVYLLARLEHLVVDPGQAIGWRVWAWAKLVKVWGSLRWSDLQAIIPAELSLVEGRLVTTLRRTKTSGPNRRVRELPVAISEYALFVRSGWLQEGFSLLKQHANYKRDYLMPRLKADGALEPKPAGYADAMVATAGLLATLGLTLEVQGYWTEHSERSVLPTALSLQDIPPHDKDLLGRWKPEGSDVLGGGWPDSKLCSQKSLERPGLSREQAELTVEGLRREPTGAVGPEDSSQDDLCEGSLENSGDELAQPEAGEEGKEARFVCSARARVPDMYNNATMGRYVGSPKWEEVVLAGGDDADDGPAMAVQILETLRAMRQLVTFCPDELLQAFANHFSRGQIGRGR
ncbi:hypothetical protein AK812_SmicGene30348 [Symbiodinium microadriaticum]|uniref:Uncharacterized protein n=1 Tax=Symbiodinium microadriaticum TaxID=2951 RepID=A0A1Q9CZK9_SYMMI|nr:hypothetical protein AK812_SmicGene30348 [Symbiodinium microadriaticum]